MHRGIRNLFGAAALCALLSPAAAHAVDRSAASAGARAVDQSAASAASHAVQQSAASAVAQTMDQSAASTGAQAVDQSAVDRAPARAPTGSGSLPEPVHRPVAVAPVSGGVVRAFEQPAGAYGPGHRGVDLAVAAREPVRAAMAGTVRFAGPVAGETWVTVTHADGIETTYGGIAPSVTAGEQVAIGERLGTMRPGRRALDWGARIGRTYIDPLGLLAGWRVRLVAPVDPGP